ncbi:AraC-like DNA-binding protein [Parabacteroides sp. PF5-5]|uniref:helix-turn-helix domain-containing protein n=1 Tax=unclassified Parabacteroides TaxID=2649774 RepID=UPI00247311E6|nr:MULTISPECIES: helix-turn-helix domain-containing protein [unclassified Parabacteroides]MDH6316894.1 AraC-like DNA-binding protein [Parabacteroides sp. PF5-13]MDH6328079.1 AraC-like DNA-binding protein [Parabacteroides sp. PH5-41]MDH6335913.1 AraC-like DNA-binding protein [Parabacteroides sp. PF5-5]MDH6346945.1 AraC-like DNA-binding protein [Parabacteroides sp. PH5-46]MDH6361907.1 AraC-like DNA-binding protein [Parabacteroides sp. PH5-16]
MRTGMIQQEGFQYMEVGEGKAFRLPIRKHNYLIFLLEGEMQISCNNFYRRELPEGCFMLAPITADTLCRSLRPCRLVLLAFNALPAVYNGRYMAELYQIAKETDDTFEPVVTCEALQKFLKLLLGYEKAGIDSPKLHAIKSLELFLLLQAFYSTQEVAKLLHPLVGNNPAFRLDVLRYYRNVKRSDDLAAKLGMESRAFALEMKREFGLSPYRWLLKRKAAHIYFSLREEKEKPLEVIWLENGFYYAGHFSRFCKEQFGAPPLKIRNALRHSEEHAARSTQHGFSPSLVERG